MNCKDGRFGQWLRRVGVAPAAGALVILAAAALAAPDNQPAKPEPLPPIRTPNDIHDGHARLSIELGLRFLRSMQTRDGRIGTTDQVFNNKYPVGQTALALLAMREAGVPLTDPQAKAAFNYAFETPCDHTYEVALQAMVLATLPRDKFGRSERRAMEILLKRFVDCQAKDGMWTYWLLPPQQVPGPERDGWGHILGPTWRDQFESGDRSNTQFAILALWEMSKCGVEIPGPTLKRAADQFLDTQTPGGAWSYIKNAKKYGHPEESPTMNATGLASLFILRDLLGEVGEGLFDGEKSPDCGKAGRLDPALEAAHNRVIRDLNISSGLMFLYGGEPFPMSGYYSYSIERVGVACGLKELGGHDWYREGAWYFLRNQQMDGSWRVGYTPGIETSLAILFLAKGRAPFIINKLRWRGDWNCHTRDLTNFVRYAEYTFEERFRWQIVDIAGSVEEWLDAPVLYLSGHQAPRLFSAEEKKKLRRYVEKGGVILADDCCKSKEFNEEFRKLVKEVFPEGELHELPGVHHVYSSHFKLKADPGRPLLGLDLPLKLLDKGVVEVRPAAQPAGGAAEGAKGAPSDGAPAGTAAQPGDAAAGSAAAEPATRTVVFYAPWTIGCIWNQDLTTNHERVFQLGVNIFRYASGGRPLRRPLDGTSKPIPATAKPAQPGPPAKLLDPALK